MTGEVRLRVRYAETDQMGVVYHANYLIWMEVGRVELCRSLGVNYRQMEAEDGILLTVVEASCRYLSPARYDDEIVVRTTVTESSKRVLRFGYEIATLEGMRALAKGATTHIFCNREMRPCQLPEKYRPAFHAT